MTRVLVVEISGHDRASSVLASEGFTVFTAVGTKEAVEALQTLSPDAVVLEVPSPSARVLDMCAAIRAVDASPLVVLSGPCSEPEAVATYGAGADALVTEPVGSHELVARVRALLRRSPPAPDVAVDAIVVGPVVLDRARRELRVAGTLVPAPRREFEIAELLMSEAGRVVPRERLVRELWGSMRDTKSLDVQVGRLRGRLAAAGAALCIVTIRGVGFRFASGDELQEIDLVTIESAVSADTFKIDLIETGAMEESAPA
jgi:DNA-binding response OmpR family regulator